MSGFDTQDLEDLEDEADTWADNKNGLDEHEWQWKILVLINFNEETSNRDSLKLSSSTSDRICASRHDFPLALSLSWERHKVY